MRRQSGLTLLEMLVVLMIAAMALTLGFQSLGQWRRTTASISSLDQATRETTLVREWLGSSLRALVAQPDTPFEGDAAGLSGITLQPLLAGQGGNTPIAWRIESGDDNGLRLQLEEGDASLELPIAAATAAAFSYIDAEGTAHPTWPPALGLHDQLPASIVLTLASEDGERLWASSIAGARNPVPRPYEAEEE